MTATTHINALRQAIYQACGVMHFSRGYRSRKLRQVCEAARGLDLRLKADVVVLATRVLEVMLCRADSVLRSLLDVLSEML